MKLFLPILLSIASLEGTVGLESNAEHAEYDFVVVGSGAGGGMLAYVDSHHAPRRLTSR